MTLINSYLGLQLIIDEDLLKLFEKEGRKFYPNEYGGILIGKYNEDRTKLFITNTILSSTKNLSKTKFERVFDEDQLLNFYNQTPSLSYVGEWHTHPNCKCLPSQTDLLAIYEIVNHPKVFIENPVLLIQSIYQTMVQFCFYVYFEKKIYPYEIYEL